MVGLMTWWLALEISSAKIALLAGRTRTHGVLLVVVLRRRVRHGRFQESFVVATSLDELFIELREVVYCAASHVSQSVCGLAEDLNVIVSHLTPTLFL